jgi:primary-amine oxidase
MASEEVVLIEELPVHSDFKPIRRGKLSFPKPSSNFDVGLAENGFLRQDVKPLQVTQPKGPSFSVNGNEISWQKFKMRIG